jgi:pimeloyl-ACP methyl ester carboxylesterase
VFEPAACAFPIPEGTSPECGYLVVPEDRSRPDSPAIRLHLAIFRSIAPDPAPEPVLYLSGGPGNSALDEAASLFAQGLGAVLERRDLILIDQRGTGFSQPRLDCRLTEAFGRCRGRHTEAGVDLNAYTSADNAADLDDLRLALGYPQINLFAFSYGTRLALTLMRDHPEAVRSVVLDSTFPPQVHLYNEMTPNAARALRVLFSLCASDPGCSAAYPDLENVFYSLVARLQEEPVLARIEVGGEVQGVKLDGGLLIDLAYSALYSRAQAERLPALIYAFQQEDYDPLEDWLQGLTGPAGAQAMLLAVHCSEEIPFGTLEEAYQAAQGIQPQLAEYLLRKVGSRYALCQEWGLPPPDPRENEPVSSDVPALVLAGEIDPVTPPEWGRLAAGSLPNAFFFEFPGSGHGLVRSSPCALGMALAFWENPAAAPEASCIGAIPPLQFALNP